MLLLIWLLNKNNDDNIFLCVLCYLLQCTFFIITCIERSVEEASTRRRLDDVELTVFRPYVSAESTLIFFLAQLPRYEILLHMLYLLICNILLSERK